MSYIHIITIFSNNNCYISTIYLYIVCQTNETRLTAMYRNTTFAKSDHRQSSVDQWNSMGTAAHFKFEHQASGLLFGVQPYSERTYSRRRQTIQLVYIIFSEFYVVIFIRTIF